MTKSAINPHISLEKLEKNETLTAIIDQLEPVLRYTLIFKYFDNLKIRQIAEIMDCPEGTVKSRLHTAKRHLHEIIKKESKRDILLGAFTFISIREAIMLSAAQTSLSPTQANIVFDELIMQYGTNSQLSFVPQPSSKPIEASPIVAVTCGTVICTSAVAIGVSALLTPVTISNIEVLQLNPDSPVAITAQINAPLKTISDMYLISDIGRRIDGDLNQNNIATFHVEKNGDYTIYAITTNNLESYATVSVTVIDETAPRIMDFHYSETELVITVEDIESEIDFESIVGETTSGEKLLPISFDKAQNTVTFAIPKEDFRLAIGDINGNISYHNVTVE